MPECVAENRKGFFTVKVLLTKQPPPTGKRKLKHGFVTVHFMKEGFTKHIYTFAKKVNQEISWHRAVTLDTDEKGLAALLFDGKHKIGHHSTYYPWKPNVCHSKYVYQQEAGRVVNPKYPVYIISIGRWERLLTARALKRMGVPYIIVVEPEEEQA